MDKERLFRNLERKYSSKYELTVNIPLGVDLDAIWDEVLQSRKARGVLLPLCNVDGEPYWYILTNKMISASEVIVDELAELDIEMQPHLSSVATIEEIYFTGFMEGAQISVQDAMNFLQSGEEPGNVEELILLNNRQAAAFAAENMYHAIDGNYLHNLAYFLTEGLDNGSGEYRITDNLEIPSLQGEIVKLPPANAIPDLVDELAAFLADTKTHPLIKAAVAQAWTLAIRPFPEGNERLARLLSNVILIRAGYSFFGNISISSVFAQTSYEYFRAIANILRIENGADLTYFIEYYLMALSTAVNEMKAKREKNEQATIEEEHRLAMMPLNAMTNGSLTVPVQTEATENNSQAVKHKELMNRLAAGLDELQQKGYIEFTTADLEVVTGLKKSQVRRLLLPYEESKRIIVIRRSRSGNIYSFKQSVPTDDKKPGSFVQDERREIDIDLKEYTISAIKERIAVGAPNAAAVAEILLDYIEHDKIDFTSEDITLALDIPITSVRNSIQYYLNNNILSVISKDKPLFRYGFCFLKNHVNIETTENASEPANSSVKVYLESLREKSTGFNQIAIANLLLEYLNDGHGEFSAISIADTLHISAKIVNHHLRVLAGNGIITLVRVESCIKYFQLNEVKAIFSPDQIDQSILLKKLKDLSESSFEKIRILSKIFIRYLNEGKWSFTTKEIKEESGLDKTNVHNALRSFRHKGLIESKFYGSGDYYFSIRNKEEDMRTDYSDEIIRTINELEHSKSSLKDRRIGAILHKCLKKGAVTKHDYEMQDASTKWNTDMSFAAQLGLVRKDSNSKYIIMHEMEPTGKRLAPSQKSTLSTLYDLFGDGLFSAEMVIANLNYCSAHVSGILHKFTWLKLLDCTTNEDNSYSYHLNVNPTDNPECFSSVA